MILKRHSPQVPIYPPSLLRSQFLMSAETAYTQRERMKLVGDMLIGLMRMSPSIIWTKGVLSQMEKWPLVSTTLVARIVISSVVYIYIRELM